MFCIVHETASCCILLSVLQNLFKVCTAAFAFQIPFFKVGSVLRDLSMQIPSIFIIAIGIISNSFFIISSSSFFVFCEDYYFRFALIESEMTFFCRFVLSLNFVFYSLFDVCLVISYENIKVICVIYGLAGSVIRSKNFNDIAAFCSTPRIL